MEKCNHPEHQDAYVDPETSWIITGEDEAWFPYDWALHLKNYKSETRGRPRRYKDNKERFAASYQRKKQRELAKINE